MFDRHRWSAAIGVGGLAWLCLLNGSATAGERARHHVESTEPRDWAGFYVGVNAGYGWGSQDIGLSATAPVVQSLFLDVPGVHGIAGDARGPLGGLQFGYNWQAGRAVYGLEADIDAADIARREDTAVLVGITRTFHGEQKLSWLATFRARLGYTPVDSLLLYATGGLAGGRVNGIIGLKTDDVGGTPGCTVGVCFDGSNSKTMWGWTVGAGAEFALSGKWSVKAEYLYYDLGSLAVSGAGQLPAWGALDGSIDIRGSIVRAGLNYKFN